MYQILIPWRPRILSTWAAGLCHNCAGWAQSLASLKSPEDGCGCAQVFCEHRAVHIQPCQMHTLAHSAAPVGCAHWMPGMKVLEIPCKLCVKASCAITGNAQLVLFSSFHRERQGLLQVFSIYYHLIHVHNKGWMSFNVSTFLFCGTTIIQDSSVKFLHLFHSRGNSSTGTSWAVRKLLPLTAIDVSRSECS